MVTSNCKKKIIIIIKGKAIKKINKYNEVNMGMKKIKLPSGGLFNLAVRGEISMTSWIRDHDL